MEDVIKTSKQVALKKDKDIQKQNSIYNCIKVWNAQAIGTHTSRKSWLKGEVTSQILLTTLPC